MSVLVLSGSPSVKPSRSDALARYAARRLQRADIAVEHIGVRDLSAVELIAADGNTDAARRLRRALDAASALVVATPIYNASLPGGLKALLDLLSPRSLASKTVLALATGGSAGHRLAIEYSLQPVLSALGARHILPGVFVHDADILVGGPHVILASAAEERLESALDALVAALGVPAAPRPLASPAAFALEERCPA